MMNVSTIITMWTAGNIVLQDILHGIHRNYFDSRPVAVKFGSDFEPMLNTIWPAVLNANSLSTAAVVLFGDVKWDPKWRQRGPVLIILNDTSGMANRVKKLWDVSRVADVAVMIAHPSFVKFYRFLPFAVDGNCGETVKLVEVGVRDLFSVVENMNGCGIRVVKDWLMPYVRDEATRGPPGVENLIFDEIVRRMNGTVTEARLPPGESVQLTKNENGELTGGAKLLYLQKIDIMYSGFTYRPDLLGFVEMLTPHTMDNLAWFVPPPKPIPGPAYLYLAFSPAVWLCVLATLISLAIYLHFCSQPILTNITATTLNLPASQKLPKLLLIAVYIYGLHITSMYQTALFFLYSGNVMEKRIETLDEAADRGFTTYFFNYHRSLLNKSATEPWQKLLAKPVFRDRHNPADFVYERNFLLLVQVNPVLFYTKLRAIYDAYGPALLPLSDRFLMYPVMFYTSRGNPIGRNVDSLIQRLVESGIVRHWLGKLQAATSVTLGQFAAENESLTWFHLSGAFGALITGLFLAFLCFLTEILINKCLNM